MNELLDLNIPVVILAGGQGTRIRDVNSISPKPMLDIGGRPIIWHIMKRYANYGFKRFVICLGDTIKSYFLNYRAIMSDFTIKLGDPKNIRYSNSIDELDWEVSCVDTGMNTMTGGRIWRARDYLDCDQFMLTYGDGVADIDILDLYKFHLSHGRMGTVTAVHPPGRFGDLFVEDKKVISFSEKRQTTEGLINGGFFVFQREFINKYLDDNENLIFERDPLENMAREGELMSYIHNGFWQCMDTSRDYNYLNDLWNTGQAKW
jgi:glucose-1-phosphate cytidylyltransferase